jgi:hypothetical protein
LGMFFQGNIGCSKPRVQPATNGRNHSFWRRAEGKSKANPAESLNGYFQLVEGAANSREMQSRDE